MGIAIRKVRAARFLGLWRSLVLVALALACASPAMASPSFPAVVDQDLGLTGSATIEKKVAPNDGCLLCHNTEPGGIGNTNAFGAEMKRNGAVAEVPKTLAGALSTIAASDPMAIADIQMGLNPNKDPKWLSGDTTVDPEPQYGCASVSPGAPSESGSAILLASTAAALVARGRGRRRRRVAHQQGARKGTRSVHLGKLPAPGERMWQRFANLASRWSHEADDAEHQ